jgi:Predicted transcriptional regulator
MSEPKKRGRPKVKEPMEQITIKLPPKMLEELRELSEKSYNPMSFHIRQAIAEYLKNKTPLN